MRITRETDYAVRCASSLAETPDEIVLLDDISKKMLIPKSFLAKILQKLVKAGIAQSFRGVKGGFKIAKNPEDITLFDIVNAIEGDLSINGCTVDTTMCGLSPTCAVHPVWVEIRNVVVERLKSEPLSNFLAQAYQPNRTENKS